MADSDAPPPLRAGLAAGLGVGLGAGLIVGLVDVLSTASSAPGGLGFAPALLGLWAVPSLLVGGYAALVAAGIQATWGPRALGRAMARLRGDGSLDRSATAAVLAGAITLVVLILFVAKAAGPLVAGVERKHVGAMLLGVVTAGAVPLIALIAVPLYRVTLRIAAIVPRLGPVPRVVVLAIAGAVAIAAAAAYFVFTRLDWRVLNLNAYAMLGALPVVAVGLGYLAYGPLAGLRRRIPARGAIVAAAAAIAVLLPVLTLRGTPSVAVQTAIIDHSMGGAKLVGLGRSLIDRDHDGYSPFFGGPDCDDHNAKVNPGMMEIAGDGLDNDCTGGDAVKRVAAVTPAQPAAAGAPTALPGMATGNVLYIMIDTLRADRLGVAGYRRDGKSLTPRLDGFAGQSVYFTHAFSQAPNTPRSMPSMMTSRYPSQVAVDEVRANYPRLDDKNVMLFEALHDAGLYTVGEASHFYFCKDAECPSKHHPNFIQGFDEFDDSGAVDVGPSNHDTASPRIVPRVVAKLGELAGKKQRFAMFVHLFEPHSTYMTHDGWPITEHGTAGLAQKYDYEIAFCDGWVGKIFDALDADGLADDTMVVIVSDHGEAFGVHRFAGQQMFFHGQTLYTELLHVPVLMRIPGVSPHQVDQVVQIIDVAPTILAALGIEPPAAFKGRSLIPALEGKPLAPAPAFAELLPAPEWDHAGKSMLSADGRWELFFRSSDRRYELYDLQADPEETHDLWGEAGEATEVGDKMKAELGTWIDHLGDP
jgi:choline-sulfatase